MELPGNRLDMVAFRASPGLVELIQRIADVASLRWLFAMKILL